MEERVCKDNLTRKYDALSKATEDLRCAQDETDDARRSKFRAMVKASGIATQYPHESVDLAPNSPKSLGYSPTSPVYSQDNPPLSPVGLKSPNYTPTSPPYKQDDSDGQDDSDKHYDPDKQDNAPEQDDSSPLSPLVSDSILASW